jgi:hypothetical protein
VGAIGLSSPLQPDRVNMSAANSVYPAFRMSYSVPRCESSRSEGTEYRRQMLYWECGGQRYYAGQIGTLSRHEARHSRFVCVA